LSTLRQAYMSTALFTGDHDGYMPSHVGWLTPNTGWGAADVRADPVLDGQSGNHTNADWIRTPYSGFLTWWNNWLLETKRPVNWGILVAEGYVDDVKGVLYCPGRGWHKFNTYNTHPYPDQALNAGSYIASWERIMPSRRHINIDSSKSTISSYVHYTYGKMNRICRSNGPNWYAREITASEWPLAFEINGYAQVDASNYGGPVGFVQGMGPSSNNHRAGESVLFFDGRARLIPDPENVLEESLMRNSTIYDWLRQQLDLPTDNDFSGWTPIPSPGRGAVDNIDTYAPLYDAGRKIFPE